MNTIDLCSLLIPFVILEAIGYSILWPIIKRKPKLHLPSQFSLADFAVLLCYVQIVMAFTFYNRRFFVNSTGIGVILAILGVVTVVLWGAAVSTLNQLEMRSTMRRMVFLLILLPGVISVMVGLPVALMLSNMHEAAWLMIGPVLVLILGIGLRYLAAWLVSDGKDLSPPELPRPPWPGKARSRPVIVVDYDPAWPQVFDTLRARVSEAVGDIAISIEHVGSTAVPGLAAKPIIDMGIVVPSQIEVAMAISRLATIGYVHRGDLGIAGREAFRSPDDLPSHHLYLYIPESPALANHLAVRDYLRRDPADAAAYGKLKKDLARTFPGDIDSYIDGKTDFLLAILRQAGFPAEQLDAIEAANRKK